MPTGAKKLADLTCEKLEVACACGRHGWYSVNMLIVAHGPNYPLDELLHDVSAECPKRKASGAPQLCGVHFPQPKA